MKLNPVLTKLIAVATVATTMAVPVAQAQSLNDLGKLIQRRQDKKNEWRNIAIGAGSLYAGFEPAGRLTQLKARSVEAFGVGSVETFMPHISLAYGVSEEQRQTVLAELNDEFTGQPIRFDAIAVVNSAQSIPIEDWKVVHTLTLI